MTEKLNVSGQSLPLIMDLMASCDTARVLVRGQLRQCLRFYEGFIAGFIGVARTLRTSRVQAPSGGAVCAAEARLTVLPSSRPHPGTAL